LKPLIENFGGASKIRHFHQPQRRTFDNLHLVLRKFAAGEMAQERFS
jgi:hypothetical protein